jgi:hypothetical protein
MISQTCKYKRPDLWAANSLFWAANSLSAVRQNTAFRSSSSGPKKEALTLLFLQECVDLCRSIKHCEGGPRPKEILDFFRRAGLEPNNGEAIALSCKDMLRTDASETCPSQMCLGPLSLSMKFLHEFRVRY